MSNDIYISYSREDIEFVQQLWHDLTERGISAWYDRENIRATTEGTAEIVEGIRDSKILVLVISPDSMSSVNVRKEVELAERFKNQIVPLIWRPTEIPVGMEYQLAGIEFVDFKEITSDENFGILAIRLLKLLGISWQSVWELITANFNSEEFDAFCQEHFSDIFQEIAERPSFEKKAQFLITYCAKNKLLDRLLSTIGTLDQSIQEEFVSEIELPTTNATQSSFESKKYQVNALRTGAIVVKSLLGADLPQRHKIQDNFEREISWPFVVTDHFFKIRQGKISRISPIEPANFVVLPDVDDFWLQLVEEQATNILVRVDLYYEKLNYYLEQAAKLGLDSGGNLVLHNSIRGQYLDMAECVAELAELMQVSLQLDLHQIITDLEETVLDDIKTQNPIDVAKIQGKVLPKIAYPDVASEIIDRMVVDSLMEDLKKLFTVADQTLKDNTSTVESKTIINNILARIDLYCKRLDFFSNYKVRLGSDANANWTLHKSIGSQYLAIFNCVAQLVEIMQISLKLDLQQIIGDFEEWTLDDVKSRKSVNAEKTKSEVLAIYAYLASNDKDKKYSETVREKLDELFIATVLFLKDHTGTVERKTIVKNILARIDLCYKKLNYYRDYEAKRGELGKSNILLQNSIRDQSLEMFECITELGNLMQMPLQSDIHQIIADMEIVITTPDELPPGTSASGGTNDRKPINVRITGDKVISEIKTYLSSKNIDKDAIDTLRNELEWLFAAVRQFLDSGTGSIKPEMPILYPIPADAEVDSEANNILLVEPTDSDVGLILEQTEDVVTRIDIHLKKLNTELLEEVKSGSEGKSNVALQNSIRDQHLAVARCLQELAEFTHYLYGVRVYSPDELVELLEL